MSRRFNGTNNYLEIESSLGVVGPFTMACWAWLNNVTAVHSLMCVANGASDTEYYELAARGTDVGDPVAAVSRNGTYNDATTSTGFTASTWFHACGVFSSTTSRDAYINGGSKGSDTVSSIPATLTRMSVGSLCRLNRTSYLNGLVAHPCVWNVALSESEIAALAKGADPRTIRPESIRAYWPLWGDGAYERSESRRVYNLLSTGATKSSNNPPVITLYERKRLIFVPTTPPATSNRRRRLLICGRGY